TLHTAAGVKGEPDRAFDGLDVLGALRGVATLPDRPWFSVLTQDPGRPQWAMQTDQWKLILHREAAADGTFAEAGETFLFHLAGDPGEQANVTQAHPEVVEDLTQ